MSITDAERLTEAYRIQRDQAIQQVVATQIERDAALAEVKRLRSALGEIVEASIHRNNFGLCKMARATLATKDMAP